MTRLAVSLQLLLSASLAVAAAPSVELVPVATGLDSITSITAPSDASGRIFVTLQGGQIRIIDSQGLRSQPFLDVSGLVSAGGERGLLSVAFHPAYSTNGLFFIDYTDLTGATIVARYRVSTDPNIADPGSSTIILNVPQPFANHNGGQLAFGPDGFLYIGKGDGGSGGDPFNLAQDLTVLLGKILRIDVGGALPYVVPPDNPFLSTPGALPEIWAYGVRNPWRFSFDRATGDLFIADVGQGSWEEVNLQPAASAGGENYGWRLMEGTHCFDPATGCDDGTLVLPILEYDHSAGDCSVTGGFRYRGANYPGLLGLYLYADFCTGKLWAGSEGTDGTWSSELLLDTNFQISAFGEDEDGELYLAQFSATDGAIYHIREVASPILLTPVGGSGGGGGGGGCFILSVQPGTAYGWK